MSNESLVLEEVEVEKPKSVAEIFSQLENLEDHPPLVIKLTDVSDSDWIKEGTDGPGQIPQRMNFPGLYRIFPNCQVAIADVKKKYSLHTIRYIAGCPSLDPKYQADNGFIPNIDQDNIWIVNGTETFLREGGNASLYDYIKLYQGNASNPHRPPTADIEFEEIIEKEVAETKNVAFETKLEAMNLIRDLRKSVDGGRSYEYDQERLSLFSNLFGLNALPSPEEKFAELALMADREPDTIIHSIFNRKKSLIASINRATDLGVIAFENDKVIFVSNNAVILPFKMKMGKQNAVNALADFLITESGGLYLKQIEIKATEAAQAGL